MWDCDKPDFLSSCWSPEAEYTETTLGLFQCFCPHTLGRYLQTSPNHHKERNSLGEMLDCWDSSVCFKIFSPDYGDPPSNWPYVELLGYTWNVHFLQWFMWHFWPHPSFRGGWYEHNPGIQAHHLDQLLLGFLCACAYVHTSWIDNDNNNDNNDHNNGLVIIVNIWYSLIWL